MRVANDEQALAQMVEEWEYIESASLNQVLSEWNVAFETLAREESELRARGDWVRGPADMFGVLGHSRAEVRHTKLVAWLLDPVARHGLGTRFLELMLERVYPGEQFDDLDRAEPACEVVRGPCRADIIVWGPGFTIVIEAKVDAEEGRRQCDEQYEQFADEPGSRFIFLTPRGRQPRTATGDAAEVWQKLSFAAIRDDLCTAMTETTPGPARRVAEDYLVTLEREFPWPS